VPPQALALPDETWLSLLGEDPRPWLLAADDPAARWVVLNGLLNLLPDHAAVRDAHAAMLSDTCTQALLRTRPRAATS
jgi:hypothetical protein